MKCLSTVILSTQTIFRCSDSIVLRNFYSTSSRIIEDVSQLDSRLDDMKTPEGLAVLINGASSCGKSTLSRHLFNNGYVPFSYDRSYKDLWLEHISRYSKTNISILANDFPHLVGDMWKEYFGFKVDWNRHYKSYELVQIIKKALELAPFDPCDLHDQNVYDRIYEHADPILKAGGGITVDAVFDSESLSYFEHAFSRGAQSFAYVLRYESIFENVKRVVKRNTKAIDDGNDDFRNPVKVLDNFRDLYHVMSVEEITEKALVIDELNIDDVKKALLMTKDHSTLLAEELFTSNCKQVEFMDSADSSIRLFEEFIDQSTGLCVVAQPNVDFIVKVELIGEL